MGIKMISTKSYMNVVHVHTCEKSVSLLFSHDRARSWMISLGRTVREGVVGCVERKCWEGCSCLSKY